MKQKYNLYDEQGKLEKTLELTQEDAKFYSNQGYVVELAK